jgi:hypothetical protein
MNILVGVIIGVIIIYFFFRKKDDKNNVVKVDVLTEERVIFIKK